MPERSAISEPGKGGSVLMPVHEVQATGSAVIDKLGPHYSRRRETASEKKLYDFVSTAHSLLKEISYGQRETPEESKEIKRLFWAPAPLATSPKCTSTNGSPTGSSHTPRGVYCGDQNVRPRLYGQSNCYFVNATEYWSYVSDDPRVGGKIRKGIRKEVNFAQIVTMKLALFRGDVGRPFFARQ